MYGPDGFWLYLHRKCTCAVVGDSIKVEEDMRAWMSKRLYIFYIIYKENKTASNYTSVSLSLKHVRFVFLCSLGIIWRQLVCVLLLSLAWPCVVDRRPNRLALCVFVCVGSVYTGLRQVCSLDTGHSLTGTLAYNIGIVASGEIKQVYSADNYKQ